MKKLPIVAAFVGIALAPLLLAGSIVFVGVLPWLMIGAIAITPQWMLVTTIAFIVFFKWRVGGADEFRRRAILVSICGIALYGCWLGAFKFIGWRQASQYDGLRKDRDAAKSAVTRSEAVAARLGGRSFGATANYTGAEKKGIRRLVISAQEYVTVERLLVWVVVDVVPDERGRKARIVCILAGDELGSRPDFDALCEQSAARPASRGAAE